MTTPVNSAAAPKAPEKVSVAPLVIAGLVTTAAMAGAVIGKLKGVLWGVGVAAVGSAVIAMKPSIGEAVVRQAVKLTSGEGGGKLATVGKLAAERVDAYTRFRRTFPDKAGDVVEKWLKEGPLKNRELMATGISKGVRNGLHSYLKFRFIFEGAIGGIAWLTYRDRNTWTKRTVDLIGGFAAGSLMEIPYNIVGQVMDEYSEALQKEHSRSEELATPPFLAPVPT